MIRVNVIDQEKNFIIITIALRLLLTAIRYFHVLCLIGILVRSAEEIIQPALAAMESCSVVDTETALDMEFVAHANACAR